MATHPMTGKAVGERVCKGSLNTDCSQTVTLLVAKTGAIYYNCSSCGAKHFYHKSETAKFLAGVEKTDDDAVQLPTPEPTEAPKPVQEPANENTKEEDESDELFHWG
ncbi:hypothetical protein [Kordiimonas sp. SCSIO 12610]|uniref:hypothetical protein n=1 Tax=Kordiimonas sp. SCSIO 12610 TaxID=2829597 RepID=UPI002109D9E5|nr:hypothetical protein [Kordiimonas sp. SCSIO 12610]UTW53958.1 hypothetical protein KFF44_08900 [Kordiimonas sp. SCSIO 12610]